MSEPLNALKIALAEVEVLLAPILSAAQGPQQRALLFAALGWDLDAITGLPMQDIDQALSDLPGLIDAVKDGLDATDFSKIADLLQSAADAIGTVDRIDAAFKRGIPALPVGSLAVDLLNYLVLRYLAARFPAIFASLALATLIDVPDSSVGAPLIDPTSTQVVHDGQTRLVMRFDRLPELITDPVGLFNRVYWPNGFINTQEAHAAADRFLPRVAALIRAFGGQATYGDSGSGIDFGSPENNALVAHMLTFVQPLPAVIGDDGEIEALSSLSLTAGFVGADGGDSRSGVILVPGGQVTVLTTVGSFLFELDVQAGGVGLFITKDGVSVETASAELDAGLTATMLPGESGSAVLIGSRDGTHFAIDSIRMQAAGKLTAAGVEPSIGFDLINAELVIKAGDGDGFLKSVLPPDGMRMPLAFGLSWSPKTGVIFHGGATLEVELPIDLDLTFLKIPSIYLSLGAGVKAGEDPKVTLGVAATVELSIGPVFASVEQMGVAFATTFPIKNGKPGPAHLSIGFKPPKGASLSVEAGPVSGGGYILADYDKGEYAGILHLDIAGKFSITCIALLQTRMPDGSEGFSLVVLVCAEFSSIQLGYGFTLNGVGGLVGINRSMNVQALQDGLRHGAIGSLLFPVDPVPRARQIIADITAIFPPTLNQFVVGPMVKIGWGADILTGTVAIVVQFPAFKIALLGRIQVALPPGEEESIAILRLDFAGILDVPAKTLSFDGSLDGSRVAVFTITGDIAMRAAFGDRPDFAMSAGGLYPGYPPPGDFPSLRRLTIALSNSDNPRLRLEAYFAITPATLQFGGGVEFYYSLDIAVVGFIEIDAAASFDALLVFPCTFTAHFNLHVLLRRNHQPFIGVEVDIRMTGAQPIDITGNATLHFLGTHSIPFHKVIGEAPPPPPLPAVNLEDLVRAALGKSESWSARTPPEAARVRLRDQKDGSLARAHPFGVLGVHQTAAPLNVTLEKAGEAPIAGPVLLTLPTVTIAGGTGPGVAFPSAGMPVIKEDFAASQYFRMTERQRLTQPPFERMQAGVEIEEAVLTATGIRGGEIRYEELEIPDDPTQAAFSWGKRTVGGAEITWAIGAGPAAVRGSAGAGEQRFAGKPLGINVHSESEWAVANIAAPTTDGLLAVLSTHATAAEAFIAARKARAVAVPVEETVA